MNKQKLAYKKLGNVSLFDNEETLDKLIKEGKGDELWNAEEGDSIG